MRLLKIGFFPFVALYLTYQLCCPCSGHAEDQAGKTNHEHSRERKKSPDSRGHSDEELKATELLITGANAPQSLTLQTRPRSVLFGSELERRKENTIGEALQYEPGVRSSYFGPGASRPIVRGQAGERVRILENGLLSGDVSQTSDDHAIASDPFSAERVEVLRGSETLAFGSSAIGGMVNIIDQSIAEKKLEVPYEGRFDFRAGDSADDQRSGALEVRGSTGPLEVYASAFYRESDDIEIPGFAESDRLRAEEEAEEHDEHDEHEHEHEEAEERGLLGNSDTRARGFKVGASRVWDDGFFGIALKGFDTQYGVPGDLHGHAHEEEHDDEHHMEEIVEGHDDDEHDHGEHAHEEDEEIRIDLQDIRLEARGEQRNPFSGAKNLRFEFGLSDYEHEELEGGSVGTRYETTTLEGRTEILHDDFGAWSGGGGLQLTYRDLTTEGEEAFIPSTETFSPALFLIERYALADSWSVNFGGRYEFTTHDPENTSGENFHALSGSTGLAYTISEEHSLTTSLSFSYSERAPSPTELFSDGVHAATQTFEVGDSELDKERSLGLEWLLQKRSGRVTGSVGAFLQQYEDFIGLLPTGDVVDEAPVFEYTLDRARFWGFEADGALHILHHGPHSLHLTGQVDYVRAKNLTRSDSLPRIPPLRTLAGLEYRYANVETFVEGVFVNSQDNVADFELPTDGYTMINAGVSVMVPVEETTLEVYLRGTNLTNAEARVHSSFLKDYAPLRGRAFHAGVRGTF